MPFAIPFTTDVELRSASNGQYCFSTDMFDEVRCLSSDDRSAAIGSWSDYPVGVLREFQKLGIPIPPFSMHFSGNVPLGAGLSSSASVEVATAMALLAHAQTRMPMQDIATLCRRAENLYVGSPCGIMDQFVVTSATSSHALLLNTRDLTFELLPLAEGELSQCVIVVVNSGVKHSVATGEYGVRRREVETGQSILRARFTALRDLGDATLQQLEACQHDMPSESFLRCRHIVTENARVREAATAMRSGDAAALGRVMVQAHVSMRDDFQASAEEIDFLVDTATHLPGCFGARMTGGGFGGCTVNVVYASHADAFRNAIQGAFQTRYGLLAEVYICQAVDGAAARYPDLVQNTEPTEA